MKMKADIEMKKLESDKRVMELIRLGKTQGGFVALSQIEEKFSGSHAYREGIRSCDRTSWTQPDLNWSGGRRGYSYARKHLLR